MNDFKIQNNTCEKLLAVHLNNRLTYDYYILEFNKKADKKIYAPANVSQHIKLSEIKMLTNFFFDLQFKHCPLSWMCHNCIDNSEIDTLP